MTDRPRPYDIDPTETREWIASFEAVMERDGPDRARFLMEVLQEHGRRAGVGVPFWSTTPYVNTIAPEDEEQLPGDATLEERIQALVRWNAMAIVDRANKEHSGLGGHISTYQSISTLLEVGFNHFWRAPSGDHDGDLVFFQGHASPGVYARAFLEGRLSDEQLDRFRQEVGGGGLPSYPHPRLMRDFWQFATVSMGLGPLMAIYQARLLKYLHHRGLLDTEGRRVWAFLGDGETDEPEALSGLAFAAREQLDNLVFVVNCNLVRLDGPVRGNRKIIQDLEADFRAAGWNVVKVVWGSAWDALFARDRKGVLRKVLDEMPDGEYQTLTHKTFAAGNPGFLREYLTGKDSELKGLLEGLSEADLAALIPGGHDPRKVYAAYSAAVRHRGRPTAVLAHTVKGFGLGRAGEALNISHNTKEIKKGEYYEVFRRRLGLDVPEGGIEEATYQKLGDDELRHLEKRRTALGGPFPQRRTDTPSLEVPGLDAFSSLLEASTRARSTTTVFNFALDALLRDDKIADRVVPIVADETRTFGMEAHFKKLKIYSPVGQTYEPVDQGQVATEYLEDASGQFLQEGINEAGAVASWIAAATSYTNNGYPLIPFYIFYSMFGFQRVGDFIWAAADMRARGFLLGGTSGRTTLNGEGLQHEDGHSHLAAATVPSCIAYDPTFSYELVVILQDGLRRMFAEGEDVFYYLTTMNENYEHPAMPEGAEEGIRKGMYLFKASERTDAPRVQLLGSGSILREVIAAAEMLAEDHGVAADVWSVTSFTELRRDGIRAERQGFLHPGDEAPRTYVQECLADTDGPIVASTDYMRSFADQIRPYLPPGRRYAVLGTDGFGRSDTREKLRDFFEVDRRWVTVAALKALADDGALEADKVSAAMEQYGIDAGKPEPFDPETL